LRCGVRGTTDASVERPPSAGGRARYDGRVESAHVHAAIAPRRPRPLLDSLRAIAVLGVLILHAAQGADTESGRTADTRWEALTARLLQIIDDQTDPWQ
jgi:hypothetical protein